MVSVGLKSLLVSTATGTTSQVATILTLYLTNNPVLGLLVMQVFGTLLAYTAQSYVFGFNGGTFFNTVLLRWLIVNCLTLFVSYKLMVYIKNMKKVKELSGELEGTKKIIFDYLTIVGAVIVNFLLWELPMRKYYIFNENTNTNMYGCLILSIVSLVVFYDQTIVEKFLGLA